MARATTTCPSCGTTFRVKPDQLAARHGQVRCGHCRLIFNGFATLSVGADTATGKNAPRTGEPETASPPVETRHHRLTLRPGDAAKRLRMDGNARRAEPPPRPPPFQGSPQPRSENARAEAAPVARDTPELLPLELTPPATALASATRVAAIVGGALLACVVLAVLFRTQVVRAYPGLSDPIRSVCNLVGCSLPLAQDADSMSIESSELRADPDHPKTLMVVATLRNRAHFAQAYPALELTLTDAQDATLLKRKILPEQYLTRGMDRTAGIAPNAEAAIRLAVGADDGRAMGYRLYLFYP